MLTCYIQDGEQVFGDICKTVFKQLSLSGEAVCELVFADMDEVQAVNLTQRGIDKPTDVLSFPYLETIRPFTKQNYPTDYDADLDAVLLGSIMICAEQAKQQAVEYGHSVERELSYLFVHGLLHLLGYDHIDPQDKQRMREAEEAVLKAVKAERV